MVESVKYAKDHIFFPMKFDMWQGRSDYIPNWSRNEKFESFQSWGELSDWFKHKLDAYVWAQCTFS